MTLIGKIALIAVSFLFSAANLSALSGIRSEAGEGSQRSDSLPIPIVENVSFEEIRLDVQSPVWGIVTSNYPRTGQKSTKPGRPFNKSSFEQLHFKVLKEAEEAGYPFAVSKITEVRISGDSIHAHHQLDLGPLTLWDSIALSGPDKLPRRLILSASGIQPGTKYRENKFKSVKNSLVALPFLESTKEPEVVFTEKGAVLVLNLKKKKANRANFLVAVQPKPSGVGYYPVGEANMVFNNLTNNGERFSFDWKSFGGGSQKSNLSIKTPFLFRSPLGLAGSIKFQKQDSTFNTFSPEFGPIYSLNAFSEVSVQYGVLRSGFGRSAVGNIRNIAEKRLTIGYTMKKTDRPANPQSGAQVVAYVATGKKITEKYKSTEESITEKMESGQLKYYIKVDKFTRILPRWTLLTALESGMISNRDDAVFQSEMFRLGGLNSLRGQDEESIFTPEFHGGSIEIRYLLDATANIHLFADGKSVRSPLYNQGKVSYPMGVGAGFSFGTGGMIFTLDYAVGSNADGNLLLRNNRVHLGFSGVF